MTTAVGETSAIVRIQTSGCWECTVTVNCVLYIYIYMSNSQTITTTLPKFLFDAGKICCKGIHIDYEFNDVEK